MAVKKTTAKKSAGIRITPAAAKKAGAGRVKAAGAALAARKAPASTKLRKALRASEFGNSGQMKKQPGFDADAEFRKVERTLIVFGGLVFDEYLAELGAAGLNSIMEYKFELKKIGEGDGSIAKLGKIRERIWEAFAIGNAYACLAGYQGNGAAKIRGALVAGWEAAKAGFYEKGVEDLKLLEIANDARILARQPNASWEAVADSIAKRHGLEGAGG